MNKKSILSKREFSKKSSKKLINMFSKKNVGDNSLSSKDLNKSYHSSNPKNKSMFDFGNNSMQNGSDDKNYDNDNNETDIESDDYSNINYQLLEDNFIYNGTNNIYSKEYLSSLKYEEYEYDTFCQSIIISGLKPAKANLIKNTKYFPAICEHNQCSQYFSFAPSILYSYQNKNKNDQLKLSDLIAELIFPCGIKVCFLYNITQKYPKCDESIMNIIRNEKGDKYYIVSFFYYKKMNLKKFQDRYKVDNFKKEIELILQKNLTTDITILVPESISLISRFPFINQMSECLKNLISITDNTKINLFVNHIINQVPVPYKNQKIKFYIPFKANPIKLVNPFMLNCTNFKPDNIFNYFSIDNIVTIFYLSLLEQQLLFIENDHCLLTSISYLFSNLTYPMSWIDTYIPILSLSSISFLQSIVPFIMGSSEYLVNYAINNSYIGEQTSPRVSFIHIKNNLISTDIQSLLFKKKGMNRKNILKYLELPQIPEMLEKLITKKLNSIKSKINERKDINYIREIQITFCDIMITILGKYKEFFFIIDDYPIFNKEGFIESQKNDDRPFYKEFVETQAFIQFLVVEKEEIKKRRLYLYRNNSFPLYGRVYDNMYVDHFFFNLKKNKIKNYNLNSNKKNYKSYFKLGKLINNDFDNDTMFESSRIKDSMDYSGIEALKMSNISSKLNKSDNNLRILLMPYFIEMNENRSMNNEQKKDYIQNKMNQILGLDNEIEKILNVHNLPYYILPSYKRYTFETIIDDNYQKYFIGTLYKNNLHFSSNKCKENISAYKDDYYQDINSDNNDDEDEQNENIFIINQDGTKQKNGNYILMDNWFKFLCNPYKKKEKIKGSDIVKLLDNKNYRTYLIQMIFQYNIPSDEFLKYLEEDAMEKLAIITNQILSKMNRDEFMLAKLITCSCFNYYTIDKNTKKVYLLVDKLKQLHKEGSLYCSSWYTFEFWRSWLKDDFISKENDIDNYLDDNTNNSKAEYFFISRIAKIMYGLGINISLIDEIIFQNLATNYLSQNQIDDLRSDLISTK